MQGLGVKDLKDQQALLGCRVRAGQEVRARPDGPGAQEQQGDPGTQAASDQPDHPDTVTRTPAWATTSEFNRTIGMITEGSSPTIFLSSFSSSSFCALGFFFVFVLNGEKLKNLIHTINPSPRVALFFFPRMDKILLGLFNLSFFCSRFFFFFCVCVFSRLLFFFKVTLKT